MCLWIFVIRLWWLIQNWKKIGIMAIYVSYKYIPKKKKTKLGLFNAQLTEGILSRWLKDIKDKEIYWNRQTGPARSKPPITQKTHSLSFFLFPNKVLITLPYQSTSMVTSNNSERVRKTIRKTKKLLEWPKMTHSFNLVA